MENPFELIDKRLERIENLLRQLINQDNIGRTEEFTSVVFMNVNEVAEYLSVTPSTIYKMTSSMEPPCIKRGKRLYFKKSEIDDWIYEGRRKTTAEIEMEASNYLMTKRRGG